MIREAREHAFRDAEGFSDTIHVIERLGSFSRCQIGDLGKYKEHIETAANGSALARGVRKMAWVTRSFLVALRPRVKDARNNALHQGAIALHLTGHTVELSLILEGATRRSADAQIVGDYYGS